ncbi:MAG: amino acid racemase [Bacteroidota bacterium]
MKKIGIIGGIGPESTIKYYRLLIELYKVKQASNNYPELLLQSIDMTQMLKYVFTNDFESLVEFMKVRIQMLEKAGVDYVAMASNTPHVAFDAIAKAVNVPMISIVEETCKFIASGGYKKVGLLGTQTTMGMGFYQKPGKLFDIQIISPNEEAQEFIHQKYMGELVFNQILPKTKMKLVQIIHDLEIRENIEGIILGGTELPLILSQNDFENIKVFDTTQIHVNSILDKMLE